MFELLYTSTLAPSTPPSEVAGIVRHARATNAHRSVTGMLVFDGQRFCQYLEGPQAAVIDLAAAIARDPRHVDFVLHHSAGMQQGRRFAGRGMSYGFAADSSEIGAVASARGVATIGSLMAMLPWLDFDP